jgi:hypothetical protein
MSSGGSRSSIAAQFGFLFFQQYFHPQRLCCVHVVYDVIGENITSNFTDLSQTIPPVQLPISVVPPPISTIMFPLAA